MSYPAETPDILRAAPFTMADVLRQVAAVNATWGLWHLDDDPRDVPAYVAAGAASLLHQRAREWWEISARAGVDLHGFALDVIADPGARTAAS
jgi:hypothetical protein